jgi:hypothetical protein
MLIKELKLTEKEMKVIINTVGNYHGWLATYQRIN